MKTIQDKLYKIIRTSLFSVDTSDAESVNNEIAQVIQELHYLSKKGELTTNLLQETLDLVRGNPYA